MTKPKSIGHRIAIINLIESFALKLLHAYVVDDIATVDG